MTIVAIEIYVKCCTLIILVNILSINISRKLFEGSYNLLLFIIDLFIFKEKKYI